MNNALAVAPTHLRKTTTGQLYPFTPRLAKRSDMRPVHIDAEGDETIVDVKEKLAESNNVPAHQQAELAVLERQIQDLENRYSQLIQLVERLTNGEDYIKNREPITPVAPPSATVADVTSVPLSGLVAPLGAVTEPGGMHPAPPASLTPNGGEGHPKSTDGTTVGDSIVTSPGPAVDPQAVAQAEQVRDAAKTKLENQDNFLMEQLEREENATKALEEAQAAVDTADDTNSVEAGAALEEAELELKKAGTKVKSATTKQANAKKAFEDAEAELAKLTG